MMPAVIFPDIERVLVQEISSQLNARTEPFTSNVLVATKKPAPDKTPYPSRIVVIRSDGGEQIDWVRKIDRIGITVWANTYSDASDLARIISALAVTLTGEEIKASRVVLSPTRIDEAGPQECRYMTLELITKGSTL
jgi:hypothetical protein